MKPRIVMDTNVLISALRSKRGASFLFLSLFGKQKYDIYISVPLILEYESAAKRMARSIGLKHSEIDDILDYLCSTAQHRKIHFLWRPVLRDPSDDMVLELAVECRADYIVTFNVKDFKGARNFGVLTITPRDLLKKIGVL